MAALGAYLLEMMKVLVLAVIIYTICQAVGMKPIAQLVKLLAILLAVQITYAAIANPVQKISKKATEIEQKLDNSWLQKVLWFGAAPESKQSPEPVKAHPVQPYTEKVH